jgi:hypothetical protein
MASHTPTTLWGGMINFAGNAVKYTVGGVILVGLAVFGLDVAAHAIDKISLASETLTNTNLVAGLKGATSYLFNGLETGLSQISSYVPGNTLIEKWASNVDWAIGEVAKFLVDNKKEVGVAAAGAVVGGILTSYAGNQNHAQRIAEQRMKLAAAEAFAKGR